MKRQLIHITIIFLLLTSCKSSTPAYKYRELARAGVALGMDIHREDNHQLYLESARWMGVPYRYGGSGKHGTDCSGLTHSIYKKVYRITLPRSTNGQLNICRQIKKRALQEGDLVFFHGTRSKRAPTHVGIYLKDGKFIHASLSEGVIISSLDENYYRKSWLSGGRVQEKAKVTIK